MPRIPRTAMSAISYPALALLLAASVATTAAASPSATTTAVKRPVVTARDLAKTELASGTVQSAGQSAVMEGQSVPAPLTGGTGSATSGGSAGAAGATAVPASYTSTDTPVSGTTDGASGAVLVAFTVSSQDTGTAGASPDPSPAPSSTDTPTDEPTDEPTDTPTDEPTASPAPSVTPTIPPTQPPVTPAPVTPTPAVPAPGGSAPSGGAAPGGAAPSGAAPSGGAAAPAAPSGTAATGQTGAAGAAGTGASAGTLTSVAAPGTDVVSGLVLYSLDGEPVVAVTGSAPLWRTLKEGVSAGADVKMLEQALVSAGYGDDLVVDRKFGADTASAVKEWEKDLGRSDPDGTVEIGDLVAVPSGRQVVDVSIQVGDAVQSGGQILSLGEKRRVLVAQIPAEDVAIWAPGTDVTLTWSDDTTSKATITEAGREVTDGMIEITLSALTGSITQRVGTEADVALVTQTRDDVLAAPVAALHDAKDGGPAVTVEAADGTTTERKVTVGLVAGGYAELTSGATTGDRLLLP